MRAAAAQLLPPIVIPDTVHWYESSSLSLQITTISLSVLALYATFRAYTFRSLKYAVIAVLLCGIALACARHVRAMMQDEETYWRQVRNHIEEQQTKGVGICFCDRPNDQTRIHALTKTIKDLKQISIKPYPLDYPNKSTVNLFSKHQSIIWPTIASEIAKSPTLEVICLVFDNTDNLCPILEALLESKSVRSVTLNAPFDKEIEAKVSFLRANNIQVDYQYGEKI